MENLTWTGEFSLLLPLFWAAFAIMVGGFLLGFVAPLVGLAPKFDPLSPQGAAHAAPNWIDRVTKYALFCVLGYGGLLALGGYVLPLEKAGIFGGMSRQMWPVWAGLILLFTASIQFKRRLGLYGKLFDSPVAMIGFGLVMFWVFVGVFSALDLIATHDPLGQLSGMKNQTPGTALPSDTDKYPAYLLGGDHLARDVFSRVVHGAWDVIKIAPLATLFAFMVGITLGLPAGYFGGIFDTVLSFIANLVLAFPVILLFYLLVTPEIVDTGLPTYFAAALFIFPLVFFTIMINARFHRQTGKRNLYVGVLWLIGGWIYLMTLSSADGVIRVLPEAIDLFDIAGNELIVFVSVVFVNAPTVFRIVRGLTLDIQTRDYVAAGLTRGEGPWYIMLWEILPNARGPLIVDFCLRIGYTTILLGTLGFFGLGLSSESPDWGSTINAGRQLLSIYAHPAVAPGLALMSLVLGLNLLADGLREQSLKD